MVAAKNAPFGLVKSKQALIAAGMEFDINVTVEELGFKLDTSSGGGASSGEVARFNYFTLTLWVSNTIYLHGRYICGRK